MGLLQSLTVESAKPPCSSKSSFLLLCFVVAFCFLGMFIVKFSILQHHSGLNC